MWNSTEDGRTKAAAFALTGLFLLAAAVCSNEEPPPATPSPVVETTAMSRIAFVSKRDGNWEIYVMNADGTAKTNLTNHPAFDSYPTWSPDGSKIAFYSDREGDNNIYVMNSDGSGQTRLTSDPGDDITPSWSPDGAEIAFISSRSGTSNLWVMKADGSEPRNLTPFRKGVRWPAWSPDGIDLAFVDNRSLYAIDPIGLGSGTIIPASVGSFEAFFIGWPDWSPDGTHLALISNLVARTGRGGTVYTVEADGKVFRPVVREAAGPDERPSWSPNGRRIAYASHAEDGERDIWVVDVESKTRVRLTSHEAIDSFPAWEPRGIVPSLPLEASRQAPTTP